MITSDSVQDNPKNHIMCLCCFSYSPFSFLFFRCLLLLPLIRSTSLAFSRNNLFPKKVSSLAWLSLDGPKPITITVLEVSPTLLLALLKFCITFVHTCQILTKPHSFTTLIILSPLKYISAASSYSILHHLFYSHFLHLLFPLWPTQMLSTTNPRTACPCHLPRSVTSAIRAPKPPSLCLINVLLSAE